MTTPAFSSRAEQFAFKATECDVFGKLNLSHIRSGVEEILKLIGRNGIFDEYTLHDMSHIDEMLKLLDFIIPEPTVALMSPTDWLLIVLGCYFHDMGLLVTKQEYVNRSQSSFPKFRDKELLEHGGTQGERGIDYQSRLASFNEDERERFYYQEFVRHHHATRVAHWIMGQATSELGASHQAVTSINCLLDGIQTKLREDLA